jgi:hypothetical protein
MKQTVITDYTEEVIISATLAKDVIEALNKPSMYPQESIFQVANKFDLTPTQVTKIYEDWRKQA